MKSISCGSFEGRRYEIVISESRKDNLLEKHSGIPGYVE